MSQQLTKKKAEACLAAVKAQFKEYLGDGADEPKLYEPGFHADSWTIAWEGGPFEWTYLAFKGGFDDEMYRLAMDAMIETGTLDEAGRAKAREMATKQEHPRPAGVFTEPLNHWALCLYRED